MKKIVLSLLISAAMIFAQKAKPILLAYESTPFKNKLVADMKALLTKQGYKVVTLDHSKGALDTVTVAAYGAVFITNSGVNSAVRPWVNTWINKHANAPILLHTTQQSKWEVKSKVDGVTSASKQKEVPTLAAAYAKQLIALSAKSNGK